MSLPSAQNRDCYQQGAALPNMPTVRIRRVLRNLMARPVVTIPPTPRSAADRHKRLREGRASRIVEHSFCAMRVLAYWRAMFRHRLLSDRTGGPGGRTVRTLRSLSGTAAYLAAVILAADVAQAGSCCYRPAPDRGIAILSPLESPDPCDSPVGGRYRYTPYYRGYAPDRRCMILYGQSSIYRGAGHPGPLGSFPANYGAFSGASRDEAGLLRLGGNGAGAYGTYRPYPRGAGDVIDRIQGYGYQP